MAASERQWLQSHDFCKIKGVGLSLKKMGLLTGLLITGNHELALAQTADQADSGTLQEIVITAQRRSENLQTVPIAVTALQGDELKSKSVLSVADLQNESPALSISNSGLTNSVNIRGIGLASGNPNVGNGVATYVDGLFQPPIVSSNQFYDIADIEVLRGPQGTLVGSNSTGGAIFINSQNPKIGEDGGYILVGAGNYGQSSAEGAINLPVNDILAFRAAGEYIKRDSFYTSLGPVHTDAGSLDEKSGRLSMLFKPGSFQALAKVEYTERNTGGYGATPEPGTQYSPYASTNPFNLDYDSPTENHERGLLTALELRQELPNGITLRSLSGYQDKNIHNLDDYDGTAENTVANPQVTYDQYVREREWTEELNVLSPKDENYNWVVGAYLQHNKIDVNIHENGTTGPGGPTLYIFVPQNKTTTGWFGQLNFKLAPQWELQTGLRYSTFKVDGDGFVALVLPAVACPSVGVPAVWGGCEVGNTGGNEQDGRMTGKVALNYSLDDNNLLYGFVARGYKAGGFNSPTSNFDPETVMDYELGWKSTLLDGHLRTQLGGFYYQYHNFQFQEIILSNGNSGVLNLATATIGGIEATAQAQLGHWGMDGGFAYVHSHLPSPGPFVDTHNLPGSASGLAQCAAGQTTGCFDYTPYLVTNDGGPNLYSPTWSANAGLEYTANLADNITLTPRVNYAFVSGQFTSLTYSEVLDYLPSHSLVSAQATLKLFKNWTAELYGTNLANKVYRSGQGLNNYNYYFYGPPRQYGIRVGYNF
jgi:iron complex outermembrane receptor protein